MHPKEFKKVKNNTGYFTHRTLENSELFVGIDFSNNRRINEIIQTHESYILFPSADALNLSTTTPVKNEKEKKAIVIFLIDATWSCASKIFKKSQNLQTLQHMSFTTTRESQYQIKEQPKSHYLSTIESTLVVLELLNVWKIENTPTKNLNDFLNPFLQMIEYQKNKVAFAPTSSVRFKKSSK